MLSLIAENLGSYVWDPRKTGEDLAQDVIARVDVNTARTYWVIPVAFEDDMLHLAMRNPLDFQTVEALQFIIGLNIQPVVADPDVLDSEMERYYPERGDSVHDLLETLNQESGNEILTNEKDIEKLKDFQTRWNQIGFVPIKEKENIQEEFRNLLNQWFDQLNLDEFDRNFKIINEREKLVMKIRQLETDIHTWENNIGFISKSDKAQSLLNELNSKIEKTKQRLALLQEKLKALDAII